MYFTEKLIIILNIFKLNVIMLATGHLLACFWHAVGKAGPEDRNWLHKYGYEDESLDYRYIMSFRWALSQFHGGMDEVTPQSFGEHLFSSIVQVMSFWAGAVFLSTLTSNMTQLYFLTRDQSQQLGSMNRYLRQNAVSKALSLRVVRNAQCALQMRKKQMPETEAGIEDLVSLPLRTELHFEMYNPQLLPHIFFDMFIKDNAHVVRKICHSAMSTTFNALGDVVFHFGETADRVTIITAGMLSYQWASSQEECEVGTFLSEAVLWTHWTHRGLLTVQEDCRCVQLNAEAFQQIVSRFQLTNFDPIKYAEAFLSLMRDMPSEDVSDMPLAKFHGENLRNAALARFKGVRSSSVDIVRSPSTTSNRASKTTLGNAIASVRSARTSLRNSITSNRNSLRSLP
jgi:hypothetical protein